MKYKLVCSDLDDTLIDSHQQLSDKVKEAITRYVDAGGKFVIATGRMTSGVMPVCRELGLTGEVLTFQGAVVTDISTGKTLEEVVFENKEAVEIGSFIENMGYYYQTYIEDYFITKKATEYTIMYGKLSVAKYKETGINVSEYLQKNNLRPPKILLMEDAEKIPEMLKNLKENFRDKYLINTSKPFIIEIVPKSINKGKAVERLAQKYNIKREEVICIGDSANDIPMLEYAGLGVAVDNADFSTKKYADIIAPSCDEDGVAWVIENYALKK